MSKNENFLRMKGEDIYEYSKNEVKRFKNSKL
jgi:hypothetical protein